MTSNTIAPFGQYAPGRDTLWLRMLTRLGLGRGAVARWLRRRWRERGYTMVDARIRGINYRLNIRDNTTDAKLLASSRILDRAEIRALGDALYKGDGAAVFVDIGANTGYYSLTMAQRGYPRIIAIEPNPPALELLRFNIDSNALGNVINVVPVCIGDGARLPLYCSGGLGTASIIRESHTPSEPVMVGSKPLLDILGDAGITRIGGLKIDIEGYEDRALFPFFDSAPPVLWPRVMVIEDCNRRFWQGDILARLDELGYADIGRTRGNRILTLHESRAGGV